MAIYQDSSGFPMNAVLDHGDSGVRAGIGTLTGLPWSKPFDITKYEAKSGWLRRSPIQDPWTNFWNHTRDQCLPMLAGLNASGHHDIIRRAALTQFLRLSFFQDFQNDVVGSWKFPFPHTYPNGTFSYFEFADPSTPSHWWCFIKGGHIYPLYILFPICLLFAIIDAWTSGTHQEQNQIISELSFYPAWVMKFYCWINVATWKANNLAYWQSRGEEEYATYIEKYVINRIS